MSNFKINRFTDFQKYIKLFEDMKYKDTIPELQNIIDIIKSKLKTINKKKSFKETIDFYDNSFFPFKLLLNVDFNQSNDKTYHSDIDILYYLKTQSDDVEINITVYDTHIDLNEIASIIHHELRHILDIYSINDDADMESFLKINFIEQFKKGYKGLNKNLDNFMILIYCSLEHELIARNNMVYDKLKYLHIKDKKELIEKYKETWIYKYLKILSEFNSKSFVDSVPPKLLIDFSNILIKEYNKNLIIKSIDDLYYLYAGFEKYFKDKSYEYLELSDNTINKIINEKILISHNYIYKKITFNKMFKNILKNIWR